MFTGFASENTPAIQVWDFFRLLASASAPRLISLVDDCAPIQVFRTGSTTFPIKLYLPTAPIEGKQITIVNQLYGSNAQRIEIYSSDTSNGGTATPLITVGQAEAIIFVYSTQNISFGTSNGGFPSGWILLNKASPSSANYNSIVVGGDNNAAQGIGTFVGGGLTNSASSFYSAVIGGQTNAASGFNASVIGGQNNSATNTGSAVVGGSGNTASGIYASVVGGSSNSATDNYAAIINGYSNSVSNVAGGIFCGNTNTASSSNAVVLGGSNNTASTPNASVLGGFLNTANGDHGSVLGGRGGTNRGITGAVTNAASIIPVANGAGFSQTNLLILGRQTTDATATVLASNTSAAGTTNQVILPNNSAYYFKGSIVCGVTGAGNSSAWTFEGLIKRGANAASTVIVQSTVNLVGQDTGASAWVTAISADTTNGGLAVTVTGQASTTIRWVCKVKTTEMTY